VTKLKQHTFPGRSSGTSPNDFLPSYISSLLTTSPPSPMTRLDSLKGRIAELTKRMKDDMGQVSDEEEEASMDDIKMEDSMATSERVESGSKTSERYNEESADLTLVSSDGVTFKVHSFALLRNS